ncbi:R3H domain-containing protein 2-like [Senna tora]|uniref:R3H domain-containing protein 2-like n=1 Tax=Senna tora TaxID=362788 RepID=A0A834WKN3_9FABA|nr:R3H domain-containing protein 2-like [Senna tora]
MEGSAEDLGAPESWEVADLDESMSRLMLSSNKDSKAQELADASSSSAAASSGSSTSSSSSTSSPPYASGEKVSEDVVNQVDQFLREAIQNPRERLSSRFLCLYVPENFRGLMGTTCLWDGVLLRRISVLLHLDFLRMEQDVEKFVRDPSQQQLEFQQLPTSYLRLAAHRVAQHYSLQSMVLLDNSLPDGSGSRIIVRKTSECRLPPVRLADIPVKLPSEDGTVVKVAIKQRPQKRSQVVSNANSSSMKSSNSKSVEERKEEYNRARARIFNSSNNSGNLGVKPEYESRQQDNTLPVSLGISRVDDKSPSVSDVSFGRGMADSSTNSSRARSRAAEKEPVGRYKQGNRVAIFRDREVDRKDPDYDRSYDRYMQRFDPGFGFNGGSYTMQPMYTPVLNYNTEFPQLGSTHGPQLSTEHQPRPLPQHLPGPWAAPSAPAGIGYGHPEAMMSPFNPNQVGAHSSSAMFLHSSQYPCQRPGLPFIHHEHVHQPFSQSHQQPPDANFGLARPRTLSELKTHELDLDQVMNVYNFSPFWFGYRAPFSTLGVAVKEHTWSFAFGLQELLMRIQPELLQLHSIVIGLTVLVNNPTQ